MNLHNMPHKESDKFSLGYVDAFYNDLFVPRKDSVTSVLEIGIYAGDSLRLWRDFFTNATIYGMDIVPPPMNDSLYNPNSRIKIFGGIDAYQQSSVDMVKELSPDGFDIVIDDGPHTFDTMVYFIQNYLPLVKSGGIMVLEDIIDPKWTPKFLEIIDPSVGNIVVHDMRGKQTRGDQLSKWLGGLDVITIEKK